MSYVVLIPTFSMRFLFNFKCHINPFFSSTLEKYAKNRLSCKPKRHFWPYLSLLRLCKSKFWLCTSFLFCFKICYDFDETWKWVSGVTERCDIIMENVKTKVAKATWMKKDVTVVKGNSVFCILFTMLSICAIWDRSKSGMELTQDMHLTHCPLGVWQYPWFSYFHTHINDRYVEHFPLNCTEVNVTTLDWRLVNIGAGNGLVTSGNKPLPGPILNHICVATWRH